MAQDVMDARVGHLRQPVAKERQMYDFRAGGGASEVNRQNHQLWREDLPDDRIPYSAAGSVVSLG
jgi:hypothetical protein